MRNSVVIITSVVGLFIASGCDQQAETKAGAPTASVAPAAVKTRVVDVTVDDTGFHPDSVAAKKGEKLMLHFKRTSEGTCATDVIFPEIDVKKALPLNETVMVEVPTDKARTLAFQCGMGMYKSSVVIN